MENNVGPKVRAAGGEQGVSAGEDEPGMSLVGDEQVLKMLHVVQTRSLWLSSLTHAQLRSVYFGEEGRRLRVSHVHRGEAILERGKMATFLGFVLAGELGVR